MRIFVSGNEDLARLHLPIAQSKVMEFAARCEKAGLSQNTFHFRFEETGATMQAQYAFGQLSLQLHAPFSPVEEDSVKEEEIEVGPKTFWANTTQGYFWVEVRYDEDGLPEVILTPFEAFDGEELVYPGMELTTAGMISGCLFGLKENRYVLAQNGGVMAGVDEEKGTIVSTEIIPSTRISIVDNGAVDMHDFLLIATPSGQAGSIRRVTISLTDDGISVGRMYGEVDMLLAGEAEISPSILQPTPCWVHRKCLGSYFSPNKTIGKHVDIGSDDEFMGNALAIPGGIQDRLDNTGGLSESLYNHTRDLYRLASLFCFPLSVESHRVTFALVCPTMVFDDDPLTSRKWWGGYGLLADQASCADYREDFSRWGLAPRLVKVTIDLESGDKTYEDFGDPYSDSSSFLSSHDILSWDGAFKGAIEISGKYSADTEFYEELGQKESDGKCSWNEDCPGTCVTGYTGTCPKAYIPYQNWARFTRENIVNRRHVVFKPGTSSYSPYELSATQAYYLLFDGLWHLDVGVLWSHTRLIGDSCYICSSPTSGQEPGQNVTFLVFGVDSEWIAANGHEYVENLEIVAPLGINTVTWAGSTFNHLSFIAKVPDGFAAPHEPVICVGGVLYPSPVVAGEIVMCQRELMSEPCECTDNPVIWNIHNLFRLDILESILVQDGCPPYTWMITGGGELFADAAATDSLGTRAITPLTHLYVQVGECDGTLTVVDACKREISVSAGITEATIDGPDILAPGSTGVFELNIGTSAVEYSGDLEFVSQNGGVFELRMPSDACGDEYSVTLSGCGVHGTMLVRPTDGQWVLLYDAVYGGAGMPTATPAAGTCWMTVATGGTWFYGESIVGKYKTQDRFDIQGGATIGTGLEWQNAGCLTGPSWPENFCTTNVEGFYIGASMWTTQECFPCFWDGPIWNGNYRVFIGPASQGRYRRVWEWRC